MKYFPHIYRIFTVGPLKFVYKTLFLGFLVFMALFMILSVLYPEQVKLAMIKANLLNQPFSAAAHLALSKLYLESGASTLAQQEARVAQTLAQKQTEGQVLAAQASALLDQAHNGPKLLENQLNSWLDVVKTHPDYRDAYMHVAALAYQLKRIDEAKIYLNQALKIDPNFKPALELQKIIEGSK